MKIISILSRTARTRMNARYMGDYKTNGGRNRASWMLMALLSTSNYVNSFSAIYAHAGNGDQHRHNVKSCNQRNVHLVAYVNRNHEGNGYPKSLKRSRTMLCSSSSADAEYLVDDDNKSSSSSTQSSEEDIDEVLHSSSMGFIENIERGGELFDESMEVKSNGIASEEKEEMNEVGVWPCFDQLDRDVLKLAVPSIANFAISPLIGAVDLFWVGRMGDALCLAGQSAANQVFNSAFWLFSFLPTITAPYVAKAHARKNNEEVQNLVCQAMVLGAIVAAFMSTLMILKPDMFLSAVLEKGAPALEYARPYLIVRAFSFLPAMVATVGFSAFRGILEPQTPLKVSLGANLANAVLDPILIFRAGMGVTGAAIATAMSEVISFFTYIALMLKRQLISIPKLFQLPKWELLKPLLVGGLAVQLRNVALNVTFLSVTRATQGLDQTGVAAAAHSIAIQVFQVGGIFLLGLATVASAMVPNEMEAKGKRAAKNLANRLMAWGCILGSVLGAVQIAVIPAIKAFSPLPEVQEAARIPSVIASILQIINGMVFIGEGIMAGTQSFLTLGISTVIATIGMVYALRVWTEKFGLPGVWLSFGVFNGLRLAGVIVHQRIVGPISTRQLRKENI